MKKGLAFINMIIALVAFVFAIIAAIHGGSPFHFGSGVWLIVSLVFIIAWVVSVIVGILQIINFVKVSKHWLELVAGIFAVIPFAGIVAFICNVVIVVKHKK